jgi:hypothetical protein
LSLVLLDANAGSRIPALEASNAAIDFDFMEQERLNIPPGTSQFFFPYFLYRD